MRRRILAVTSATALALSLFAGTALAASNPSGTAQPSQECDEQTSSPAGFETGGFANAEARYANPDAQGGTASGNWHVVSQYDVACFQVSQH